MPAAESRMRAHPAHANVMRAGRPCRTTIGGVRVRRRSAQVRDRAHRPGPGRLRGRRARRRRTETGRAPPGGRGGAVTRPASPTARLARSDAALLRASWQPAASRSWFGSTSIRSRATREGSRPCGRPVPAVTGSLHLGSNRVRSYRQYLTARMTSIADSIRRTVPGTRILRTFDVVYGGASMLVPAGRVRDVLRVPGVVAVQRDRLAHTLTTTTPHFLGADQVWPTLGGPARAGRNVVIGVLDSGIWPEHPSFRDVGLGPFPRAAGCQFGDGSDPALGEAVHLQPQADRRLRVHRHLHVRPAGRRRASSATTGPASARHATPTATGRIRHRPRPALRRRRRSSACRADA